MEKNEKSGVDILKEEANIQEIEEYKKGVNWVDDEYLGNSWKRLKAKTLYQIKQSDFLSNSFHQLEKYRETTNKG